VLKLPVGVLVATAAGVLLAGAAGLVFLGVSAMFGVHGPLTPLEGVLAVWLVLAGVALLIATLHGLNWIARACGALAVRLLGIGDEELQLWEAQRRADAAERARRELILNVSHELRTPIASIRGHVDTLLMPAAERPAEATPERYLPIVSGEASRLGSLVEDLLVLSRADAQRLTITVREVALDEVVTSAVAAIAPVARRDRGVTVAHERELPALRALADADRLAQILGNLLRNAVNHTPEGGAVFVQIGAEAEGARVWIDVSDTGSGIPAGDLDRIFERFYRGDASRSRDSGGYGLGLPIARELAEAMGGGLTVTSEVGAGSRFRLVLRQA
jgi:signal transduction histidine kinase